MGAGEFEECIWAIVSIYCSVGLASSLECLVLRELGYDVANYDTSWKEWGNDASLPIVSPMAAQYATLMQKMLRALSLRAQLTLAIVGLCALALRQQEARLHADAERLHQVLHNDLIELTLAGSPDKAAEFVIKINRV